MMTRAKDFVLTGRHHRLGEVGYDRNRGCVYRWGNGWRGTYVPESDTEEVNF